MAEGGCRVEGGDGLEFPEGGAGDKVGDMGVVEVGVAVGGGIPTPTGAITLVAQGDGSRGGRRGADGSVECLESGVVAGGVIRGVDDAIPKMLGGRVGMRGRQQR